MNRIETAILSAKVQLSQDLFEASSEHMPDCGFISFMKIKLDEHWESLDYELTDLVIDAHSLIALPSYDSTEVHFNAVFARAIKDM